MGLFNRNKNTSDEDLMRAFQNGKEAAFDELYRRYSKRILHFMFRMLNFDEARAQDLLQDLFLKLVEQPNQFDPDRKFKPWIFAVAANLCRKEHRHPTFVEIEDQEVEAQENIDQLIAQIDHTIFRKKLKQELNNLSYEHKAVFILRFQEKLSVKEIAQVLDCAPGTVKSRIHYTVQKLAKKLEVFNPINSN